MLASRYLRAGCAPAARWGFTLSRRKATRVLNWSMQKDNAEVSDHATIGKSLQHHTVSLIDRSHMSAPCALVARSLRAHCDCALAARSSRAHCALGARSLRVLNALDMQLLRVRCSARSRPFALATNLACRALVTRRTRACFALFARWLRACRALGLYAFAAQSDTCFELQYAKV